MLRSDVRVVGLAGAIQAALWCLVVDVGIASPAATPSNDFQFEARGFLTDDSHPRNPQDVRRYEIDARIAVGVALGEVRMEFDSGEGEDRSTDRYFIRRGRIFQIDDEGTEKDPEPLGDLTIPALAALHPWLVENAMRERPENVQTLSLERQVFAWNDVLWTITRDSGTGRIVKLVRPIWSDLLGDSDEVIQYEFSSTEQAGETSILPAQQAPREVVVRGRGRELGRFEFSADFPAAGESVTAKRSGDSADADTSDATAPAVFPEGQRSRDHARRIAESEVQFTELAPHLFSVELSSMNTRIVIAEFQDHLIALEGAYNSANVDLFARAVRSHFPEKPVRYFAFSHLHGQYLGGVRSWVAAEAVVLVPPSTAPLVERIASASFTLQPDVLSLAPRPLRMETVPTNWRQEDGVNTIEIYNVPDSDHTDEYFLFYFPRSKVLMTGDLLFWRPGKPLTGRSKKLCDTVARLGLDVDRYVATWPLDGYETKNVVTREEMAEGCK